MANGSRGDVSVSTSLGNLIIAFGLVRSNSGSFLAGMVISPPFDITVSFFMPGELL